MLTKTEQTAHAEALAQFESIWPAAQQAIIDRVRERRPLAPTSPDHAEVLGRLLDSAHATGLVFAALYPRFLTSSGVFIAAESAARAQALADLRATYGTDAAFHGYSEFARDGGHAVLALTSWGLLPSTTPNAEPTPAFVAKLIEALEEGASTTPKA